MLIGGERDHVDGAEFADGYYFQPTVLKGDDAGFQEENFGPMPTITTFTDDADALAIANDGLYGLGAGSGPRTAAPAYKMGRGIKAGRVWRTATSGIRRCSVQWLQELRHRPENPRMMLDHSARRRTSSSATAASHSGCSASP